MGNVKRRLEADAAQLLDILGWARPHESGVEVQFCRDYLDVIGGMEADHFGNRILRLGDSPRILWSSHVDTVAARGGRQDLRWLDEDTVGLLDGKPGQSLGADDGVGVWLMLQLIQARRPGLYVFHRGEECGRLGSNWLATHTPKVLSGINAAIALDRAGYSDVITHQMGQRCASDAFANSLAAMLNVTPGFGYAPDSGGVYTDTLEYQHLAPECLNLSVGYHGQHGPRETLDVTHAVKLRDALLRLDESRLVVERVPGEPDE